MLDDSISLLIKSHAESAFYKETAATYNCTDPISTFLMGDKNRV